MMTSIKIAQSQQIDNTTKTDKQTERHRDRLFVVDRVVKISVLLVAN